MVHSGGISQGQQGRGWLQPPDAPLLKALCQLHEGPQGDGAAVEAARVWQLEVDRPARLEARQPVVVRQVLLQLGGN